MIIIIIKRKEKTEKYIDIKRELKKLGDMKVTVTPFLIDAIGIVIK